MVSSISEEFYNSLPTKPLLKSLDDFQLEIRSANGSLVPYMGYIEASIVEPKISNDCITTLVLVVPTTQYHLKVPVLLGTNIIREMKNTQSKDTGVPEEWKTAFMSVSSASVGTVKSTRSISLKPNETRTVIGIVRKSRSVVSAVTEPLEEDGHNKAIVCPRVVELKNPGKTSRVPVKMCNLTAKVIRIPSKSGICDLQEVKVLREASLFNPSEPEKEKGNQLNKDKEKHSPLTSLFAQQQSAPENENIDSKCKGQRIQQDFGVDIEDSDLSNQQKDKLYDVFAKWEAIFPKGPNDIGHTTAVKHKIDLNDNTPFKETCRRIPPAVYNEVKEHLKDMLEIGAIRESNSSWSSNVVIVRKKDGTIRFCIDFRKLNQRTKKDAYAIPRIDETLHLLAGSKYFSKLDLKSGYWQVELEEADKEKTAFQVAGIGFFEANRMPFGLCNAPATFQRLMEKCMGELNLKDCLIYLDDIVIYSPDIESHIEKLDKVFGRLASYNLKIKPSKCEFFKKEITYLGHIVSQEGIKTDPEKTEVVQNWPIPKSVKETRKFLGFVGYYRRFIKGFAAIARPLNNLLIGHPLKEEKTAKKKLKRIPFVWKQEQQQAFETLKEKLVNPPILGYADYSLPFKLHTDASALGLGAVLYQRQDTKDRVIAYASRSLKPAEKNYPAHKLEYLALKWSVTEKFHDYLYGTIFEVVTDNNPLTYVNTSAKLDATGQRWMAALSNYNFTISYRKGKQNTDADGLSRIPQQPESNSDAAVLSALCVAKCTSIEESPLSFSIINPDSLETVDPLQADEVPVDIVESHSLCSKDWRKAQNEDPVISEILDHLRNGTRPSAKRVGDILPLSVKYLRDWDRLELRDGVLYRMGIFKDQPYHQLVLPDSVRVDVFKALHDDLGHQGRDRTISLFKQRFFWPGMDRFVEEQVRDCPRCIRRKTPESTASLVTISSAAPMEIVCIDFLSLERSKGGFEHILVVTDHFTRYAQAFPTKNQTAKTTAKVLFEQFFIHYGFPERIHSDQGANFESTLIKELCQLTGTIKSHTTPYHAMGNGMVERFNQTLLKMLGTLDEDKKADWKSYVGPLVHSYNVTIHESTGFAPYYLMFGRQPKLAIDALLGLNVDDLNLKSRNEYVRKLRDRLTSAYNTAKQVANKTSLIDKQYYDQKAKASSLIPGDMVLVRNVSIRGKNKIADRWENEPYTIINKPRDDIPVFQVRKTNPKSKTIRTLHRNLLLPLRTSKKTSEVLTENKNELDSKTQKYIIPQRRKQNIENVGVSITEPRPKRNRRKPEWQRSGDWVLN
jgi:transposase InsO family protein